MAAAEPSPPATDHAYLVGGVTSSVDHFLNVAYAFDGGVRVGDLPIAVHATGAKGGSLDADNGGDFWRLTAGVEGRTYLASGSYGFIDVDAGYQHQTWSPNDLCEAEEHRGSLVGARVGFDGGGEHARYRLAAEAYRYHREFVDHGTTWNTGVGLIALVGYRL